ncbi:BIG2 domain-containing protein [Erwinia rhapontici]|uniref:Ig-like domain-containing protein n=1 Tax=Erwinia rhapontici TaxID=55212 RepID=UPI003D369009
MDQKFFRIPFARSGDKQAVPDDKNSEGYVSFTEGWGGDYAKDLYSDAHAKAVEREAMNGVLNAITVALRQYQTDAFPEWITPANNGGTAYRYGAGVVVRHRNGGSAFTSYVSLEDNNTAEPGTDETKWQAFIYRRATQKEADKGEDENLIITPPTLRKIIQDTIGDLTTELAPYLLPVGIMAEWGTETPPSGWLECDGGAFDIVKNPKLYALYPSGRVPQRCGLFPRGWAHGNREDPDFNRPILSVQQDAMQNHSHIAGAETILSDNVPISNTRNTPGGSNGRQYRNRTGTVNPSHLGARLAGENRPKNIAVMYIIKTDQADKIKPDPTPSNIVVTPSSLSIGVGSTRQFKAQVLPAELASKFPVTWLSTDTSVGTIDAAGLFRGTGAGSTDIIGSVSSGLSVRVTVRVDILLISISLAAIPNQVAGDTYELKVMKTPSNATESISYASTDSAVASATADGLLITADEGAATISVTGDVSGKSFSRIVKVTAAPVEAVFLEIKKTWLKLH